MLGAYFHVNRNAYPSAGIFAGLDLDRQAKCPTQCGYLKSWRKNIGGEGLGASPG